MSEVANWRRTNVLSLSVATSTYTSMCTTTRMPYIWRSCCSATTSFNTSLSQNTETVTLSISSSPGMHDTTICDLRVGGLISDHAPVYFRLCVTKAVPPMQQVTRRAWRRLSTDAFASDLAASELCGDLTALDDQTVDELVQLYNQVMTALLDRHCPTVTVHRRVNKKTTPWFDADCRAARRRARAPERRFKCTFTDAIIRCGLQS